MTTAPTYPPGAVPPGYVGAPRSFKVTRPDSPHCEILSAADKEILLSGPMGTGKTRAICERLVRDAIRYPDSRILVVRRWQNRLAGTVLVTLHDALEGMMEGRNRFVRRYGGGPFEPTSYQFGNGTQILVTGLDNPSKVKSAQYDLAFISEVTELETEEQYELVLSRLRNRKMPTQQLISDCNPGSPYHWVKRRADGGRLRMMHSTHKDNPVLWRRSTGWTPEGTEYVEGTLGRLTGVNYKRNALGLWVAAEGAVYDEWDDDTHVIDAMPPDFDAARGAPGWRLWMSVDFGFNDPTCVQWWAQRAAGGPLVLYRELMVAQHTSDQVGALARAQMTEAEQAAVWTCYADHSPDGQAAFSGAAGVPVENAPKGRDSILEGIMSVQRLMRADADGLPGLLVLRSAPVLRDEVLVETGRPASFLEEIVGYCWQRDPDGRLARDKPQDKDNHSMDAARYFVAGAIERGGAGLRWIG